MTSGKRKAERATQSRRRKHARTQKRERDREKWLSSRSFSRKLDRASDHVEALGLITKEWLRGDAYRFVPKTDPHTHRTVVRAQISEPPPSPIAMTVGDAIHNLRSALDHLALELAVANHRPHAVPPKVESASEFPIFPHMVGDDTGSDIFHRVKKKTGAPVPGSGLYKLQGIHADAIKAIEGIQPYHRGPAYAEDPLWVIHELDRIDKHRRANLTAYAMGSVALNPPTGSSILYMGYLHIEKMGHNGPVEDGTEVAVLTVHDSDFQMEFARKITLAEATIPHRDELVATLTSLRNYVRNVVVPLLTPFL